MTSQYITTLKKRLAQLVCLLIILQPGARLAQAQKTIGLSLGTSISGNGHGSIYIPQLCLGSERNTLMLGACLQKQAMKFNGVRLAYSFILSGRTKQEINMDDEDSTEVFE